MGLTTKQIEKAVIVYEKRAKIISLRTSAVFPNHECDVLAITQANYAVEYEIKRTRSDFFADFKKKKHQTMSKQQRSKISRFYYVVPVDMIKESEIPEYAGLIYVDEKLRCSLVKQAPRLKSTKITLKDERRIYRSIMYRWLKIQ